jgi:hypothetical protein
MTRMCADTARVVTLLSLLAVPGAAQEAVTVEARVDTARLTVGDRVTLTATVEHDREQSVTWPAPADALGAFEVLDVQTAAPVTVNGRARTSARYVLTAFELGELEIPPLEVSVSRSGDANPLVVSTDPVTVTVQSVGRDDTGDIRAIKPPLEIPRNWLLLAPWFLIALALGALGYWWYRRHQKRAQGVSDLLTPTVPRRPPHVVAYEALDRLAAAGLLERREIKPYFINVSEIIRNYLDGRFGIDAMEMTTPDVLGELELVEIGHEAFERFVTFFERSDLVKFAKFRPDISVCREMIPLARQLVDETRAVEMTAAEANGLAPVSAELSRSNPDHEQLGD